MVIAVGAMVIAVEKMVIAVEAMVIAVEAIVIAVEATVISAVAIVFICFHSSASIDPLLQSRPRMYCEAHQAAVSIKYHGCFWTKTPKA